MERKERELGNGYKFYYTGEDGKRNGVDTVFSPELKEGVIQFNREKDSDVVEAGSKQDDSEHHQCPTFKM